MKKNVWIFGLIGGLISSVWIGIFPFMDEHSFDPGMGMVYGYTLMIVSSAMIFVGIKNFRDRFNGGEITFGKAFKVGLYISLIASSVYVLTWLISYYFLIPDFWGKMAESTIRQLKESGATQADIDAQMVQIEKYKEFYKNPLFNIAMTYTEILPVTLILSLIYAAILKRNTTKVQIA